MAAKKDVKRKATSYIIDKDVYDALNKRSIESGMHKKSIVNLALKQYLGTIELETVRKRRKA